MTASNNFQSVKRALLKMCSTTEFPENRLPSEADLAKMLRVSIVTVRKALTVLETEGYILKRHGIGNFVLASALDPTMRIDLTYDMISLLETSGFSVVEKEVKAPRLIPGPCGLRERLNLSPQTHMLSLDYLFRADGEVVIIERFYMPETAVQREPQQADLQRFDTFVWRCCQLELQHSINTWRPLAAGGDVQTILSLSPGQPLISWEQTIYDIHDIPVCGADVFFHPERMNMRSLFKWNFTPDSYMV